MKRIFGIETEYGITVDGQADVDVVHESIEIVRRYAQYGISMKWDYRLEDPHMDSRGFRADELLQDTDEADYFEADQQRPLSFREIKSDLVLTNGARLYNDHAHPEYSTPECYRLSELVAHDKAGELILHECTRLRNAALPEQETVRLYKNNTDFAGHSYGTHDNYLMRRDVPWEAVVTGMIPFLITRQLFAGAGKLGIEREGHSGERGRFQLSQRADFLSVRTSIDTMNQRPIVNTRDEPHADPALYRRFHCIIGDANMNEIATALKVGTTALVLGLIENGNCPQLELGDPMEAARLISHDGTGRWLVPLADGRTISGIDIQRLYLDAVSKHHDGTHPDTCWILAEWERVLDDLALDPIRCMDRVDWVTKKHLLSTFRDEENLQWDDPWLQSLDLEYHNIDPDAGLYHELVRQGAVQRLVSDEAITAAVSRPPDTTRAFFRGEAVRKFHHAIASIQWDEVVFRTPGGTRTIPLTSAVSEPYAAILNAQMSGARRVHDLFAH